LRHWHPLNLNRFNPRFDKTKVIVYLIFGPIHGRGFPRNRYNPKMQMCFVTKANRITRTLFESVSYIQLLSYTETNGNTHRYSHQTEQDGTSFEDLHGIREPNMDSYELERNVFQQVNGNCKWVPHHLASIFIAFPTDALFMPDYLQHHSTKS